MIGKLTRALISAGAALSLTLSAALPLCAGQSSILGTVVSTDIVAYIDGAAIPSYNYNSDTIIIVEELLAYGFDVVYNNNDRSLRVTRNPDKPVTAAYTPVKSTLPIGTALMSVLKTDIKTYIDGSLVKSYNVGGLTVIPMDALAALYPSDYKWDAAARTLSLELLTPKPEEVFPGDNIITPVIPNEKPTSDWREDFMEAVAKAAAGFKASTTIEVPTEDIDMLNEMLAVYDMNTTAWTHFAWVSRWVLTKPLTRVTVSFSYIADKATIAEIDRIIDPIVAELMTLENDWERVLRAHDIVCEMVTYDYSYPEDEGNPEAYKKRRYHITGVVLDGLAVCQGYTETLDYILKKCGIRCEVTQNPEHSWNIVYIGDMGYHVDATWDDTDDQLRYNYFMRSTQDIIKSHDYEPGLNAHLNDDSLGWFRVKGLYFDSLDLDKLKPLIVDAMRSGRDITFEFASPVLADEFHEWAFDDYNIFDLLPDAGRKSQTIWYVHEQGEYFYTLNFSELT